MTRLHRVETYGSGGEPWVGLSFVTKYRGYWQCCWTKSGMDEFPDEPPFESLRKCEQREIEEIGPMVFYFTHGKLPEDLNT